jgi:hypothetical protein
VASWIAFRLTTQYAPAVIAAAASNAASTNWNTAAAAVELSPQGLRRFIEVKG